MEFVGRHVILGEDKMKLFAADAVREVSAGDVLLLYGDLGSGKTTFTKYLAQALGVEDMVTSPTFTIAAEYEVRGHKSIRQFIHMDLYRTSPQGLRPASRLNEVRGEDLEAVRDVIQGAKARGALVVIEWADRLGEAAPQGGVKLEFEHGQNPQERVITISHGKEG